LAIALFGLSFCILAGGAMAEGGKIADPSTMLEYEQYFSDSSTEYAGLIWTDKSVFKTSDDLKVKNENGESVTPVVQCGAHTGAHQTIALTPEWENQPEADNPNFLVALSASASNKSITGYEKRPTDTILVLDITGSMDSGSDERIKKLVPAVNHAIEALMKNNLNNRIGVVAYAQNQNRVVELLPLNRYTVGPAADKYHGNYISVAGDGDYVWVNSAVRRETDSIQINPDGEQGDKYQVHDSTYIQGGLEKASQLFQAVNDVSADITINGEVHNVVRRIPALILVTDGNPTKTTADYTRAMDDDAVLKGSGGDGDTTLGMAFLCQLTSIWVKEEMGEHYNEISGNQTASSVPDPVTPLFYTLGIMTQDKEPARAVLYPANNAGYRDADESMSAYWNTYKSNTSMRVLVSKSEVPAGEEVLVTKQDGIVTNNRYSPNQNYVDGYFKITTDDQTEYDEVFQAIVRAIELQSRYTPTMLQISDAFYDGYVTFIDDIGEHMEVKDVKGFVLDGKLFTGEHVAQMLNPATLGSLQSGVAGNTSGHKLIDAIATRLGLNTTVGSAQRQQAIALITQAYQDGLLGTKENNENFAEGVTVGNSFGWFADEDGNFIAKAEDPAVGDNQYSTPEAYWNWLTDEPPTLPTAEYKVRSYIFYDEIEPQTGTDSYGSQISELNTVYMSVQVREHIDTGKVSLIWRIPSRLLPVNQYSVALKPNNTDVDTISLNRKLPASLIYEVGPKDGYKSYQIEKTMRELKKPDGSPYTPVDADSLDEDINHIVTDEDGYYHLYTNAVDMIPTNPANVTQHVNTVSYFKPSNQNERYRFSAPTYLYKIKDGSLEPSEENTEKVYNTGATLPAGQYWYKQYVFVQNGEKKIETVWHELDSDILNPGSGHHNGHKHVDKDAQNYWYVTVNTIEYPYNPIIEEKKPDKENPANPTDTLTHSSRSVLEKVGVAYEHDGIQAGDFVIANVLGNNGLLKVRQDTGIAISKVSSASDQSTYNFTVTLSDREGSPVNGTYALRYEPEHTSSHLSNIEFVNGVAEIPVKAGETAHIIGLAGGELFSITEEMSTGHKLETIVVTDVDGRERPVLAAEGISVVGGHQIYVTFTNLIPPSPDSGFGMLALKKIATHNYKYGFDIPKDAEFRFQLTFEEGASNFYADDVLYDTDGNAYELDANGVTKEDVILNPNQVITFAGLKVGTTVTVKEIVGPEAGYRVEEITVIGDSIDVEDANTVKVVINDHTQEYRITVNNMYMEPYLPATGDNSRLILWVSLLGMCAMGALLLSKRRTC